MKIKYIKVKPSDVKEIMLKTYSEEEYPYARAFISAYEKFINPKTEVGFFGNGGTVVAQNKFDNRIGIVLRDYTKLGDYWSDFGVWSAQREKEYERFSISLGYYPKYSSKTIDDPSRIKILKDKLKHPFTFQELYLLEYYKFGSKITFKYQGSKKQISKCDMRINHLKDNDQGNILNEYARQILEEYKILTFQ